MENEPVGLNQWFLFMLILLEVLFWSPLFDCEKKVQSCILFGHVLFLGVHELRCHGYTNIFMVNKDDESKFNAYIDW